MAADPLSLTPPEAPSTELVLTAPEPVGVVAPEKAEGAITVDAKVREELRARAASYVGEVVALDHRSPEFTKKAEAVLTVGDRDIRAAAASSNRMLQRPAKALDAKGLAGKDSTVGKGLVQLRVTVEDLDPSKATGTRKLLGFLPFGDQLKAYFGKYQSAQSHIDAIIASLLRGQDELRMDNAAIEQEKTGLWGAMQRLQQLALMVEDIDVALEAEIATLDVSDPDRAKALRSDVLFPARQKRQDLLTQLAVSVQGYLSLDLLRRNNTELIKGVDRATTTTVSALRTAVIVAQALTNQKLVLDQIGALNKTTGNLIEGTSRMMREQSAQISEQAASTTIDMGQLQAAFQNVYAAMDAVDEFRVRALGSMQQTVDTLRTEVEKAQAYVERVSGEPAGGEALQLPQGL